MTTQLLRKFWPRWRYLIIILIAAMPMFERPIHAQVDEASADLGAIRQAIENLNDTALRLVELLEIQLEGQQAVLLLRRVEFGETRLAEREGRLRTVRVVRDDLTQSLEVAELQLENMSDGKPEEILEADWRFMKSNAERQLGSLGDRLFTVDQEIIDLEREVVRLKEDLGEIVDIFLQRLNDSG